MMPSPYFIASNIFYGSAKIIVLNNLQNTIITQLASHTILTKSTILLIIMFL
jgi:hypothetical protein